MEKEANVLTAVISARVVTVFEERLLNALFWAAPKPPATLPSHLTYDTNYYRELAVSSFGSLCAEVSFIIII